MKIYTKTGDKGTTSLFGGKRVDKDDFRIRSVGAVDEVNSVVGVIISDLEKLANFSEIRNQLERIQNELFVLGGDLSAPIDIKIKIPRINTAFVRRLEKEIDNWQKELSPLKNFILPGGSDAATKLHFARSVTRRAEREISSLSKSEKLNSAAVSYINRLSDWFFVLARYVNKMENKKESIWKGRS